MQTLLAILEVKTMAEPQIVPDDPGARLAGGGKSGKDPRGRKPGQTKKAIAAEKRKKAAQAKKEQELELLNWKPEKARYDIAEYMQAEEDIEEYEGGKPEIQEALERKPA
jgi:hypothetical protein